MESVTLRSSKTKNVFLLAGSLAFVFTGFWTLEHDAAHKAIAVASIAFFGLGVIVSSILLLPNASLLRLDHEGFTFVALFRATRVPWAAVESIHAGTVGFNRSVLFDLVAEARKPSVTGRVAVAISGHHGALPETYGMTAKALAEMMNKWKQQHHATPPPTPPTPPPRAHRSD